MLIAFRGGGGSISQERFDIITNFFGQVIFGIKITLDYLQKTRKNAKYYSNVLRKKSTLWDGRGGGVVAPFGIKITLDYWPKNSIKFWIIQARVLFFAKKRPNVTIFLPKVCPLLRTKKIGRFTFGKQMIHFGRINVLLRKILIFRSETFVFTKVYLPLFLSETGEV